MARDMDLFRKILFEYEKIEYPHPLKGIEIEGYTKGQILDHQLMIEEAEFAEGKMNLTHDVESSSYIARRLTYKGHEFLEQARHDNIWNNAKTVIKEKGIPMTFEVISKVITEIVSNLMIPK